SGWQLPGEAAVRPRHSFRVSRIWHWRGHLIIPNPGDTRRDEKFAVPSLLRCLREPLHKRGAPDCWGGMKKTWFNQYQERQAEMRKKQQNNLTAEQIERYAREVRREMQDLIQVRSRERLEEEESAAIYEAVWETISDLADGVLDEAIGVVYEERKAKAATAA